MIVVDEYVRIYLDIFILVVLVGVLGILGDFMVDGLLSEHVRVVSYLFVNSLLAFLLRITVPPAPLM